MSVKTEELKWLENLYYPEGASKGRFTGRFYGKYANGDPHILFSNDRQGRVPADKLFRSGQEAHRRLLEIRALEWQKVNDLAHYA